MATIELWQNPYVFRMAIRTLLSLVLLTLALLSNANYQMEDIYVSPGPDNQPTMIFTEPFLGRFDGTNPNEPIYVSIRGVVFDVTPELEEYNPDNALNYMAGKDVSRAIAKNSTEEEELNDNLDELTDEELENLDNIYKYYKRNFRVVGYMSSLALKEKINTEMDVESIKRARIRTKNTTETEDQGKKKKKKKKNKGKKKKKEEKKESEENVITVAPLETKSDTVITGESTTHYLPERSSESITIESVDQSLTTTTTTPTIQSTMSMDSRATAQTSQKQTKPPMIKADDLLSKKAIGDKKVAYDVKDTSTISAKDYYVPYKEKPENDYFHDKFAAEYEEKKKSEL